MWKLVSFLMINLEGIMQKDSFLAFLQTYNFYSTDQIKVKEQILDVQKIADSLIDIRLSDDSRVF